MHVEIDADCRRGLRIIEEIPDLRPCKIEGYNGIGKTSAIRLLQLCTGEQPFAGNNAAWRSFASQLVRAKVRITGLREVNSIEWILKPGEWPKEEAVPLGDEIGTILIDGRRASIRDVKPLLGIHRLNTTETPVKILSEQAAAAGAALEGWYFARGERRGTALDNAFSVVLKRITNCPPGAVRLAREVVNEARTAAGDIAERTARVRNRVQVLSRAVDVADQLDTVRGSSPQMQNKLHELEEQLIAVDARRASLNRDIEGAQLQKHLSEQAENDLEKLEKLVTRYDNAFRRTITQLERAAAAANVEPSRESVIQTSLSVEEELNVLVDRQPIVSRGPQLYAVLNDLVHRLEGAISANLGDSVLIDEDTNHRAWTIADLHTLFVSQRDRIAEHGQAADAEQLERKIAAARMRLDALAIVNDLIDSASQAETRLKNAEQRLVMATDELPGSSSDQLNELLRQRNELDREGRDLQSRIDRLRAELELLGGGHTEEALAAELDRLCLEMDVDPSRVHGFLERERINLNSLSQEEASAQAREAAAVRQMDERIAAVEETARMLTSANDFEWLRRAVPVVTELQDLDIDGKLAQLEILESLLSDEREVASTTISAVRSIGAAMDELATRLRNQVASNGKRPQAWTLPVGQWLAKVARQWLDDDIVRSALFNGGENVRLNTDQLTISWTLDGEYFERPLEVFSSGEQAFAFTRARVAQLERDLDRPANRLIALDEFGAFLDVDRFAGLSDYLIQRQLRIPEDHILVILPWAVSRRDASADLDKTTRRDAELARRGYFAEALQA